jgi:hypothetical protein
MLLELKKIGVYVYQILITIQLEQNAKSKYKNNDLEF